MIKFELIDNVIIDSETKMIWTYDYLKNEKNIEFLLKTMISIKEKEKIITANSFFKSRNYLLTFYPELML